MLNEDHIIASLQAAFPEHIGDDAAVIPGPENARYVLSKDLLVEDVHFRRAYFDASSLAYKALQVNLSDIAAMGAKPQFVLLGLAAPQSESKFITEFLDYFTLHIKNAGLLLIGGDTTRSPDKLFISITVIGSTPTQNIKERKTAQVGDLICVAGQLGKAHLGFIACEQALTGFEIYQETFLRPNALLNEGVWLGEKPTVTSMMDMSDGLCVDLKRLAQASKVAARLDLEKFIPEPAFKSHCQILNLAPIEIMLSGAEDYGLLFTIRKNNYAKFSQDFLKQFGYELKMLGEIIEGKGLSFFEKGQEKKMNLKPFSHFGESL